MFTYCSSLRSLIFSSKNSSLDNGFGSDKGTIGLGGIVVGYGGGTTGGPGEINITYHTQFHDILLKGKTTSYQF